jgi:hypothetical protein
MSSWVAAYVVAASGPALETFVIDVGDLGG